MAPRWFVALALAVTACRSSSSPSSAPSAPPTDDGDRTFGGDRPVTVRVPAGYDPAKPAPLLLMLHGYGSGGIVTDIYLKMTSLADQEGFFYVAPDGTIDADGKHFWNATDACCDFGHTNVDDVGYLTSLVHDIQGAYAIDPKRIYVMGHSNGGYMANRLACDRADVFAAAVSFAGAMWSDATKCQPSTTIGYLQIHGTKDTDVLYDGSSPDAGAPADAAVTGAYPGAEATVAFWAGKNGCASALTVTTDRLHVSGDSTGDDTTIARHDGCAGNGAAELWTVAGAPHVFAFTPDAVAAVYRFLDGHPKR